MKKEKQSLAAIILIFFLSIIFIIIFIWDNEKLNKIDISEKTEVTLGIEFYIDEISIEEKHMYITGWAFKDEPLYVDRSILLRNVEDASEVWELNTVMIKREELNEIYNGNYYSNAGFFANGKIKKNMRSKDYEVLIFLKDNKIGDGKVKKNMQFEESEVIKFLYDNQNEVIFNTQMIISF